MSSHHIIRENQEPALIIANGQPCSNDLLGELLEWSPKVIVLDGAYPKVQKIGIKIDILLGDFDRNFLDTLGVDFQEDIEIVHRPDQDKTDLEKAIEYLIETGHHAANIVWATGFRMDHTFSNIANLVQYRDRIKLVVFDDFSRIYPLPNIFEKWYPKGEVISLIPIGKVEGINTSGLMYNLQNESLTLGYRNGNSNETIADGFVKIEYTTGDLVMMECWD